MKRRQQAFAWILAGLMTTAAPLTALAGVPEFGRTEEEWALLRDDRIEYDEIADLVHEYNATVKKNQIDLNEFRKDYGETNDKWADRYRELADEVESSLVYPDVDDSGYASAMSAIVTGEMQVEKLREQADDAVEDYLTYYYDMCSTECLLVSQAQSNMISWYQNQQKLRSDEKQLQLLQEQYQSAVVQSSIGMATEVQVLTARESLRNAEKTVQDDQAAIENVHQRLMVLLGWSHDAGPEIGDIPEVDMERIASMNPETDKQQAIENSYMMKSNRRKLENARTEDVRQNLQETIAEDEQNIGATLKANYQNVLSSKAAYELGVAQAGLAQRNLQSAKLQFDVGNVSRLDYITQEIEAEKAQLQVETAKLNLFQAVESYNWALNGLAGTSAS